MQLNITKRHLIAAVSIVLALISVGLHLAGKSSSEAAADRATLKATIDQQGKLYADLTKQIADRDKKATADKADIDRQVATAKQQSLEQQAALVSALAGLKTPIIVAPQKDAAGKPLPDAPQVATLTPATVRELLDQESSCKKCSIDLAAAQRDNADLTKQKTAVESERDAAIDNAHGGSKLERFKRAGKTLFYGALIGIAVDQATRRH